MIKNKIAIFFIILFISCSNYKEQNTENEVKTENKLLIVQEDNCIFDLKNQTSEFLANNKNFENFIWIDSIKTAIIELNEKDTLSITKGGCIHYNFYIKLNSYSDTTDIKKTNYWIEKIKSLTTKIPNFENELVYSLFKNNQYDLEESERQLYYSFHQENYCHMSLIIEQKEHKNIIIEIGYYLC
jgi:hypothetical protein